MQLSELATLLRGVADAIDGQQRPEQSAPEPQTNVTQMFAPPAEASPPPAKPEPTPTITRDDVIDAFQRVAQQLGQQQGTDKVISILRANNLNRVSEASEEQLAALYQGAQEALSG